MAHLTNRGQQRLVIVVMGCLALTSAIACTAHVVPLLMVHGQRDVDMSDARSPGRRYDGELGWGATVGLLMVPDSLARRVRPVPADGWIDPTTGPIHARGGRGAGPEVPVPVVAGRGPSPPKSCPAHVFHDPYCPACFSTHALLANSTVSTDDPDRDALDRALAHVPDGGIEMAWYGLGVLMLGLGVAWWRWGLPKWLGGRQSSSDG